LAHYNLGVLLSDLGRKEEVCLHLEAAAYLFAGQGSPEYARKVQELLEELLKELKE